MLQQPAFDQFMRLVGMAGQHGMPMPRLVPGHMLSGEQLKAANAAYDEARNAHYARTLKGRAK